MKKILFLLAFTTILCMSGCKNEADTATVNAIEATINVTGTTALETTDPAYAEITALLERQHELEFFMETQWERKEGLDTWEVFEEYAQEVYTKEYVNYFFTPKYFGEDNPYYYLDEEGVLTRRETDGIVFGIKSNTVMKMTSLTNTENVYAVVQERKRITNRNIGFTLLSIWKRGFGFMHRLRRQ